MDMSMQELIMNVKDWARARGIDKPENVKSQFMKLVEEFGELDEMEGVETVGQIGYMQLALIILTEQLRMDYTYALRHRFNVSMDADIHECAVDEACTSVFQNISISELQNRALMTLGRLAGQINKGADLFVTLDLIGDMQLIMHAKALLLGVDYHRALQLVYDTLSNLTKEMEEGAFVKTEDLHD